jgi:AcrR family transcriptional regulator
VTTVGDNEGPWLDRAADRSPAVQRSRDRSARRTLALVEAALRLMKTKGSAFTTQDLAKEAGVALQTFYRHFAGKDQLLLAVFERVIAEEAAKRAEAARALPDPVARLHLYVTDTFTVLRIGGRTAEARFVTAEHWRLYQLFPNEMNRARSAYADLIEQELRDATSQGLLASADPAQDAWLITQLITSSYHHYAFSDGSRSVEEIVEHLWTFCLTAVGGGPSGKGQSNGRRRRTGIPEGT